MKPFWNINFDTFTLEKEQVDFDIVEIIKDKIINFETEGYQAKTLIIHPKFLNILKRNFPDLYRCGPIDTVYGLTIVSTEKYIIEVV